MGILQLVGSHSNMHQLHLLLFGFHILDNYSLLMNVRINRKIFVMVRMTFLGKEKKISVRKMMMIFVVKVMVIFEKRIMMVLIKKRMMIFGV